MRKVITYHLFSFHCSGKCFDHSCFDGVLLKKYLFIPPSLRWNMLPYPTVPVLAMRLDLANGIFMNVTPEEVARILSQFGLVLLFLCHSS